MSLLKKFQSVMAGPLLSAALLLTPAPPDAMEIKQFNQLSKSDHDRYYETLLEETVKYLWRQGRKEDGDAVLNLFGRGSSGVREFVDTLDGLAKLEQEGQLKKVPHVEHAMFLVLKDHNIKIPMKDFMQFSQDFKLSGGVMGQPGGDHRGR